MARGVAYIRVSTREQDENVQRQAIEEFAKARGIEIVEWYVDKGESGAVLFRNRPEAKRLLTELESRKPDVVLTWSIDRFGRTMQDTFNTISELETRGYRVVTVKEEWLQTLDDNVRKLILSILAWVAEFERRRIRERQEEAWKSGKPRGRPPVISDEEVERYAKRYPTLTIAALTAVINADRARKRLPTVSMWTVRERLKRLGYVRVIAREEDPRRLVREGERTREEGSS